VSRLFPVYRGYELASFRLARATSTFADFADRSRKGERRGRFRGGRSVGWLTVIAGRPRGLPRRPPLLARGRAKGERLAGEKTRERLQAARSSSATGRAESRIRLPLLFSNRIALPPKSLRAAGLKRTISTRRYGSLVDRATAKNHGRAGNLVARNASET